MQENGEKFTKSTGKGRMFISARKYRKMKWYPIIRILLYLRDIESKEKNYEEVSFKVSMDSNAALKGTKCF